MRPLRYGSEMIRKPNRLKYYDYSSSGYYFLTICTKNMKYIFGKVTNGKMGLNINGKIVLDCLHRIPIIYSGVMIDEFVIMPNHIHLIMIVETDYRTDDRSKMYVSKVIQQFKRTITMKVKKQSKVQNPIWQRYFYDRIIKNEIELYNIRKYIKENPIKWELEKSENIDYDMIL